MSWLIFSLWSRVGAFSFISLKSPWIWSCWRLAILLWKVNYLQTRVFSWANLTFISIKIEIYVPNIIVNASELYYIKFVWHKTSCLITSNPVDLASSISWSSLFWSLYPASIYLTGYVSWFPLSHVVRL